MDFLRILLAFCFICQARAVPLPATDSFCTSVDQSTLIYTPGTTYTYTYATQTTLSIPDTPTSAQPSLNLSAKVSLTARGNCLYHLQLSQLGLAGDSVRPDALDQLTFPVQFRLNAQGQLDSSMSFATADEAWSKNIKRAIVSLFQVRAYTELRSAEGVDGKSGLFYEEDSFGTCSTTYSVAAENYQSTSTFTLDKSKDCGNNFKCQSAIKDNLVDSVSCTEAFETRAVVSSELRYASVELGGELSTEKMVEGTLKFEAYTPSALSEATGEFSPAKFTAEICSSVLNEGLVSEHSVQFKSLVVEMRGWSSDEMVAFYENSNGECDLAGMTVAQAIVFANTDSSVEASLKLMESDAFASQKYISEYPVLTALARNRAPSVKLVEKMKEFLNAQEDDFEYMNKLSLVYSSLVHRYCEKNGCEENELVGVTVAGLGKNSNLD